MPCPCIACHVQGILVCLNVRQHKLTEKSDIKCDKKKAGVVIDINVPSSDHRGFNRL